MDGKVVDRRPVPFRLRVGVVGHRDLDEDKLIALRRRVRQGVDQLIGELKECGGITPVCLRAVSPLAEGADRLVASEVLEYEGADLEAVLPFAPHRYREDFLSPESKSRFESLRKMAVRVTQVTHTADPGEAYERAGRYVLEHSDVVFLVWDGEPPRGRGGTASTVAYMRDQEKGLPRRIPHFILDPTRSDSDGDSSHLDGWDGVVQSYGEVDLFNSRRLLETRYEEKVEEALGQLVPDTDETTRARSTQVMQELFAWSIPLFVRSDLLANRMRHFTALSVASMTVLSLLAVCVATLRAIALPSWGWLTWLEIGFLGAAACVFALSRVGHFNQRWIEYRALSEKLRAAPWLAATHPRASHVPQAAGQMWHSPDTVPSPATWQHRLFDEVWTHRPHPVVSGDDLPWLKRVVAAAWLGDQIEYHTVSSRKHQLRYRMTRDGVIVLFLISIGAALLHAVGATGKALEVLIIVLPAGAASIGGFAANREYHRHADRYSKTREFLEKANQRIEGALDMNTLRTAVDSAYECVIRENHEWFDAMRFHEPVISG